MKRFMGIDFGMKRCGIAMADDVIRIASPHSTVDSKELEKFLAKELKDTGVVAVVLGFPRSLDGSDTHITENVRRLERFIQQRYPNLEVHLIDERFTSKMAQQSLLMSGAKKKQRQVKGTLDRMSAAILLQDWLDWRLSKTI